MLALSDCLRSQDKLTPEVFGESVQLAAWVADVTSVVRKATVNVVREVIVECIEVCVMVTAGTVV